MCRERERERLEGGGRRSAPQRSARASPLRVLRPSRDATADYHACVNADSCLSIVILGGT